MKTKFLFSTLLMATAFSACTQEELVVNNENATMEEVVGAKLLGKGFSMNPSSFADSRVNVNESGVASWEEGDKAAVAWVVKGATTSDQTIDGFSGLSNTVQINHMLVYGKDGKFTSRSGVYEGWHFAYTPLQPMVKPQQLNVTINPALEGEDLAIDQYENMPQFSNAKFVDEEKLNWETGEIDVNFPLKWIANSLRPVLNVSTEFTEDPNNLLQNIAITGITLSAGSHELFTESILVQPKYLNREDADNYEADDFGSRKAFVPTYSSTITTEINNADFYNLGKESSKVRIFLAPTKDASSVTVSDLSFRIDVVGGHFDITYTDPTTKEDGKLTADEITNNNAILKLLCLLNGESMEVENKDGETETLNSALRDLKKLTYVENEVTKYQPAQTIQMALSTDNFYADYLIEDIDDWTGCVNLANALLDETDGVPTFNLKKGANVKFTEEITAPANGVKVTACEDAGSVTLTVDGELDWNENISFDLTKSVHLNVASNGILTVNSVLNPSWLYNSGVIKAGVDSKISTGRFSNSGSVIVEYGAEVYPNSGAIGRIAYALTNEDVDDPTRVEEMIAIAGGTQTRLANVNTLIIGSDIAIDLYKTVGGSEGSSSSGEYVDTTTPEKPATGDKWADLQNIALEIEGGSVNASFASVQVKKVTMKGGNVENVIINNELIIKEGTNNVNVSNPQAIGSVMIEGGNSTIYATEIGSVVSEGGENAIHATKVNGVVTVEGSHHEIVVDEISGAVTVDGNATIVNAEMTSDVTINSGTTKMNEVEIAGKLLVEYGASVVLSDQNTIKIGSLENNGDLLANNDIFATDVTLNAKSTTTLTDKPVTEKEWNKTIYHSGSYVHGAITLNGTVTLANGGVNVNGTQATAFTQEGLNAALANTVVSEITLGEGSYTLPNLANKTITIEGTGNNVALESPTNAGHNTNNFVGSKLIFKNVTIKGTVYSGSTHGYNGASEEYYENCVFETYHMFAGETVNVKNCTFELSNQYIWTGSAKNITFTECDFNCVDRAVKVLAVAEVGNLDRNVTFNKCNFSATTKNKAVLEGASGSADAIDNYFINIIGCTMTGEFDTWFHAENNPEKYTVNM